MYGNCNDKKRGKKEEKDGGLGHRGEYMRALVMVGI